MASITLKDVPDELVERLRIRAEKEHRSMNQQAIHLLEIILKEPLTPDRQMEIFRAVAGKWESDLTLDEEIKSIVGARRSGRRKVDLDK